MSIPCVRSFWISVITALHEQTASLSMENDTTKLWILTKLLDEDNPEKRQTDIESQNEFLTQKRAANCFVHMYRTKSRAQWNSQNTYGQMHDWNHLEGRTRSINQNAENQEKASPRRSHKRRDPLSRAISQESLSGSIQQVLEDRHHSSSV